MHNFLRVVTDDATVQYLNVLRIERIEIRKSLTEATVFLVDKPNPIAVHGDSYGALIEYLGTDQE
jgi:hypothetical protein